MGALSPEPDAPASHFRWLNILALVAGLLALALGPLAGGLFVLLSLTSRQTADTLSMTTIGLSVAALGLGFGGALAWVGYHGLRGRPSRPFRPGPGWLWGCLAASGVALLIGQLIISLDLLAPVTFPLFHILGVSLPAIVILLLFGRGLASHAPAPTQPQVLGQMALGALGMTLVSFILEALVAVIALVVVAAVVALLPGGLAQLAELQAMLADPTRLQDPQALAHWLLKPGILILAAVMLMLVVPIIEEGAKSLGVPLLALGIRAKPAPAQGWLWGVAVGAGFAIAEGLFNSAASLPFWAGIVLLRAGASAMHMVTAGLTGLGWARMLTARSFLSLLASYLASLTLHGLWNGLTVLIVIASLQTMAEPGDTSRIAIGGVGMIFGLIGLILLMVATIGVAIYITRRVGEPHR